MSARVVLDVEAGLTLEEAEQLRQLLYDAFGEFVSMRSGRGPDRDTIESAIEYVAKRYPEMGVVERARKAEQVMQRKTLARKLHLAASDVRVEEIVPVADRMCKVLPTYFPQSVEAEAKLLAEAIRDGQRDESSPLTAYAKPAESITVVDIPFTIVKPGDE